MDRPPLEDLLQLSLRRDERIRPVYSVRAGFLVAFFGGLVAAVGFSALNTVRAQRVAREAPLLGVLACAGVAYSIWAGYAAQTHTLPTFLTELGGEGQGVRLLGRAVALAGFGVIYLLQRDLHAAQELRGQDSPSAWVPGIICCIVGFVVQLVLALLGVSLGQP